MSNHKNKDIILPLSLFLLTVITRIPFTSKYLYHWDSVQFALALEKYDITVHQPHPPGYFLYIMLGRLINRFINDANSTFIFISILFSCLTIVAIYYLGKEIFDKKTGILAALIALTSPNLWFHGEVALTYVVEAFFSSFVALLCWRILRGAHKYLWLSVIALGIAGGIRQNTIVFLLPLWLFSVKGVPLRKIITSVGLLGVVCLLWFVPMVWMTGGWNAYYESFREYKMFVIGHFSVFERGWDSFEIFSLSLFKHLIYSLGAGIVIIGLAAYSLIRRGRLKSLERSKVLFFCLWLLPSVFFYLMILYHPASYGYVLILLPALFILTTVSIKYINDEFKKIFRKDVYFSIASLLIILSAFSFFLLKFPVSYREIRNHDRNLAIVLHAVKGFDPENTAIFVGRSISYGFRHFLFYLPNYRVYHVDERITSAAKRRKMFWGMNKETFACEELTIPGNIDNVVFFTFDDMKDKALEAKGAHLRDFSKEAFLISGPVTLIREVYPHLGINFDNPNGQ
jgi:hypothetical protein